MHTCPMFTGPVPHVGGPIIPPGSAQTVLINGFPAATVGTMATCVGPPDMIVKGSATVFINGTPAARIGDQTAHGGAPGSAGFGMIVSGAAAMGIVHPLNANASVYGHPIKPASAPQPKAAPVPAKALFPCKSAWAKTVAHTNSIAFMQDPIARNKKISADYAQM